MKAFQIQGPSETALVDIAPPVPAPDHVLVKIEACALNFADTLMVTGKYQEKPDYPFTPGLECAGTVESCGALVEGFSIGDRVACFGGYGGLAQYGSFEQSLCTKIPTGMSFDHAAAFQIAYGTSLAALSHRAHLTAGETLLVTGAAGGVGLTAIEVGKQLGARVIACARGAEKLETARQAGADHLIETDTEDLLQEVKTLGGADVVYETIGGDVFNKALRSLKPEGRMIPIGFAGGEVPQIPANYLLVKNLTVIGLYWGGYRRFAPEVITQTMQLLSQWYEEGKLHPHISHSLPLAETETALNLLRDRKSTGKVIVRPWG